MRRGQGEGLTKGEEKDFTCEAGCYIRENMKWYICWVFLFIDSGRRKVTRYLEIANTDENEVHVHSA